MLTGVTLLSGQVTSGYIGNAAVVSGSIASGQLAHPMFAPASILSGDIASGSLGSFLFASGVIRSGQIGDAAVVSGGIASGTLFTFHVASGGFLSGAFGSGQIGAFHLASGVIGLTSGAVRSGLIGDASVNSGNIASGSVGFFHVASGAVTSGRVGNAAIVSGSVASGQIGPFHLASGTLGLSSGSVVSGYLGNASVLSGTVGSGQIGANHIASGAVGSGRLGDNSVLSGSVASGQIGLIHLASGTTSLLSGIVRSGIIGDNSVVSGSVASGQLSTYNLASGTTVTNSQFVAPFISGTSWSITTEEIISGVVAVNISQSGNLRVAMASVSGRMPAVGVVVTNVLSGISANVYTVGAVQLPVLSGMMSYSGYLGQPVYVGRSGQLVTLSGAINSGGFISGDYFQVLGTVRNSGGVLLGVTPPYLSGTILSSGAVQSGIIASGAVVGSLGAGARTIASGTIGPLELGSGSIVSGAIASGQIGVNHFGSGIVVGNLASGSILSGKLASGSVSWPTIGDAGVQSGNIASGSISAMHMASGAIQSGSIGSGALIGANASGARNIASGTVGTFDLGNQAVNSGNIGSGQLTSYHHASGATVTRAQFVGPFFSGFSGAGWSVVTEERISGVCAVSLSQSGNIRIAKASVSGLMPAIGIVVENVESGIQANVYTNGIFQLPQLSGMMQYSGYLGLPIYVGRSGQIVSASGCINSGGFASGDAIQNLGVVWNSGGIILRVGSIVASGSVASVVSGSIASGSVGRFILASGAVNSGHIASGAVVGSLGGGAFTIASGTVGPNELGSGAIQSGAIASGSVGQYHLASGATATKSQFTIPFVSGSAWNIITEEIISGVRAVAISQSGTLRMAMASVSGRMPAVGVVTENVLSGIAANVLAVGPSQFTSGLADYSGFLGQALYVGRSGHVVSLNGSWNSGGFLSGDVLQTVGHAWNSGASVINLEAIATSGSLIAVGSGEINSGSISRFHLASGAVNSGHVGSGAVVGSLGGGARTIASGTVGPFEIGSGAIRSGAIASGQLGQFHFSTNSVYSGAVASGQISNNHLASGSVQSGHIVSGSILGYFGSVGAWMIASGTIGTFDLGNSAIVSGHISAAQIGTFHIASGTTVTRSQFVGPLLSGSFTSQITEEIISGIRAVAISQSGNIRIAKASVSGLMPAVGIVVDNVASGIAANVYSIGTFQFASGMVDFSGFLGQPLLVGRSGQIAPLSGSYTSGGFASGDMFQTVGTVWNSGGAVVELTNAFQEGLVLSGNIGSGQIGHFHLQSGSLSDTRFVSGAVIHGALVAGGAPLISGNTVGGYPAANPSIVSVTAETISGGRAVAFNQSGQLIIAMASVSGRMPAVGVTLAQSGNALSGTTIAWMQVGGNQYLSGMADYSGFVGKRVWVGRSGQVTAISGSWSSGGFLSGDLGQPLGIIANSGGVWANVFPIMISGGPVALAW